MIAMLDTTLAYQIDMQLYALGAAEHVKVYALRQSGRVKLAWTNRQGRLRSHEIDGHKFLQYLTDKAPAIGILLSAIENRYLAQTKGAKNTK